MQLYVIINTTLKTTRKIPVKTTILDINVKEQLKDQIAQIFATLVSKLTPRSVNVSKQQINIYGAMCLSNSIPVLKI